jgi:hypothetical protein
MSLMSDAVMVIFCDVSSDPAGHDDWHTHEHMHERLSIPGFLRGTRWTRASGSPRYMIVYEVESVEMASSPPYLERLNHPTDWTTAMMARLRGMSRGFCHVAATAGYGLGHAALSMRFSHLAPEARQWLAAEAVQMASRRGMASVSLFEPVPPPPMTKEQALRGRDSEMTCVLLATAHDAGALALACDQHLAAEPLARHGISLIDCGTYQLGFTATAAEVARTRPNRSLTAGEREAEGPRA